MENYCGTEIAAREHSPTEKKEYNKMKAWVWVVVILFLILAIIIGIAVVRRKNKRKQQEKDDMVKVGQLHVLQDVNSKEFEFKDDAAYATFLMNAYEKLDKTDTNAVREFWMALRQKDAS